MLLDGDLDAVFSAHAPREFEQGNKAIVRMFPEYRSVEEQYFKDTGVFPIMHTVAIRRDVYERNRWVARNLFDAFREAKRRSIERLTGVTASHFAVPWQDVNVKAAGQLLFGTGEYWPYGIEGNRPTLEAFYRWCYEQGVTARHLKPEEIYAPETLAGFKI
jgi:4,5-dihydroxyphthalate decarboxylase